MEGPREPWTQQVRKVLHSISGALSKTGSHLPPIAIPNKDLTAKNSLKLRVNPVPNSNTISALKLITNGHFLPYRSDKDPNISAPTDLSISVTVRPYTHHAINQPQNSTREEGFRESAPTKHPNS